MLPADVGAALAQRARDLGPLILEQHAVDHAVAQKADNTGDYASKYHPPSVDFSHLGPRGLDHASIRTERRRASSTALGVGTQAPCRNSTMLPSGSLTIAITVPGRPSAGGTSNFTPLLSSCAT